MIPEIAPEAAEFWEATRDRVLLIQRCVSCGRHQHYPRAQCLGCGGSEIDWIEASGRGTIYSFTASYRSPFPDDLPPPYVIALIDLAEGPRILSRLDMAPEDVPECGDPVILTWSSLPDGRHLPMFTQS